MILHIALKIALKYTVNTEYVYKERLSKTENPLVVNEEFIEDNGLQLKICKTLWIKMAKSNNTFKPY